MSNIDPNTLHHNNAEIQGTAQVLFSENATSRDEAIAKGYVDLGNFLGFETKGEAATTAVLKACRGVVREANKIPGILKQGYDLKTCELADARKARFWLMGENNGDFSQDSLDASTVDPLNFSTTNPAIHHAWYPITKAGAQIRELTAITIGTLTEGKDFAVDKKLGLVRFIDAAKLPTVATTPKVSAPEIKGSTPVGFRKIKPMTRGMWKGYVRILIWDQDGNNNLVMDHMHFSATITLSSPPSIGHENLAEMKINISIGSDVGEILVRD